MSSYTSIDDIILKFQNPPFSFYTSKQICQDWETKLRNEILPQFFPKHIIEERFALPDDLVYYMNHIGGSVCDRPDWWWIITDACSILNDTDYEWKACMSDMPEDLEKAFILIPIGYWSDKHTLFVSCDKNFHWGGVFDCHDSWACDLTKNDKDYDSFLDFLFSKSNYFNRK